MNQLILPPKVYLNSNGRLMRTIPKGSARTSFNIFSIVILHNSRGIVIDYASSSGKLSEIVDDWQDKLLELI